MRTIGRDPGGALHAYMLTPVLGCGSPAPAVPEPDALVLFVAGILTLGASAWRLKAARQPGDYTTRIHTRSSE